MVKASNVDMSLEDIINKNRKKGGVVKRPSIGKRGGIKRPVGGNRRRSDGWRDIDAPENADFIGGGSGNKVIRVNISNLAASVIASDLDELFGKYGVESAVVNYNEHGDSLGNGDITLRKRDAERLINQFTGVALDGKVMKFAIIDSSLNNIRGRVDFGGRRAGATVGGRSRGFLGRKKSKPEDFLRDGVHEGDVKRGGGARRGRGGKRGEGRPKKSEAELDAELEAYMSKRKA